MQKVKKRRNIGFLVLVVFSLILFFVLIKLDSHTWKSSIPQNSGIGSFSRRLDGLVDFGNSGNTHPTEIDWASSPSNLEIWEAGNILENPKFQSFLDEYGELILQHWRIDTPNPSLAPDFRMGDPGNGKTMLMVDGTGQKECFGMLRQEIQVQSKRWYTFKVRFAFVSDENELVHQHVIHSIVGSSNEVIEDYKQQGDGWFIGVVTFQSQKTGYAECRLHFRFSTGRVVWDRVSLVEHDQSFEVAPRLVKIACTWTNGNLSFWSDWLDWVGSQKVDIAVLPEFPNSKSANQAEDINTGETFTLLSNKAKQWNMYVTGALYEKRGDMVYNTAPLYDRNGFLIGTYEKTHLYEPEIEAGVSPGSHYPVFQTDFGYIGILICYDSWFPEPFRLLARQGAELILFPSVAYYDQLLAARSSDNGLWIAASAQGSPGGVWDSAGSWSGEVSSNGEFVPTSAHRRAPTSIVSHHRNQSPPVSITTVDLRVKYSPHWFGTGEGSFRSAPGGRRSRDTSLEEIKLVYSMLSS